MSRFVHKGEVYVQAADPAKDLKARQQAAQVLEEVKERIEAGHAIPACSNQECDEIVAWVLDMEPSPLRIMIKPPTESGATGGSFGYSKRGGVPTIVIHSGAQEGFWDKDEDQQRELLRYVVIPPIDFVHEYVHYQDSMRAPKSLERARERNKEEGGETASLKDYIAYLSDPAEFNAWYQGQSHHIEEEMARLDKLTERDLPPYWTTDADSFVEHFMWGFRKRGWPVTRLPAKLQRKIRKRLAGTFQYYFGEKPAKKYDVEGAIETINDSLWSHMTEYVEGYDYLNDWQGVVERFQKSYGDSFEDFLVKAADELRFREVPKLDKETLDPLTPSHKLKFKSEMRKLYKELLKERDYIVEYGKEKQKAASFVHQGSVYRLASKEIFYHGTASGEGDRLLKKILKEGLIPDPKERVWSGDRAKDPEDFAYWQNREKESLGGIYFSTDPGRITTYMLTAMQTIGGDEVAVIAQLETRSPEITLDEEALFGYYRAAVAEYIEMKHAEKYEQRIVRPDTESLPRYLSNMDIDWEDVALWFIENRLKDGTLQAWPDISDQRIEAITPLLAQALRWQTEFLMASYYSGRKGWTKSDYLEYGEQDPEEALQKYRVLTEKVLQKFRELAEVPEQKSQYYSGGHEVRVTEPVNYKGANKIMAVLRVRDARDSSEPYYRLGEVVYSTPDASGPIDKFINAMKQSWSQHMLWTDKTGNVIYDKPKAQSALASGNA